MKKRHEDYIYFVIWILLVLIVLSCIATSVVAYVKYGNKPITEIPAWALLFMFGGRGGR